MQKARTEDSCTSVTDEECGLQEAAKKKDVESSEIKLMQTRWEGGMRQKKMDHLSFQKVKRCDVVILEQR